MSALDDLEQRIATLEQRSITVADIPLVPLMRTLEQKWLPDASVLLRPGSITKEALAPSLSSPAFRMVRGSVAADGSIVRGTGFTVTKNGAGDYTVTFDPAFTSVPVVNANAVTWVAAVQEFSRTASSFRVITYVTTTGANTDQGFDFMAATA